MKKWNETITRKEIKEMSIDQLRRQIGIYTTKLVESGIERDDARRMASNLMVLGEMAYRRSREGNENDETYTEVES